MKFARWMMAAALAAGVSFVMSGCDDSDSDLEKELKKAGEELEQAGKEFDAEVDKAAKELDAELDKAAKDF